MKFLDLFAGIGGFRLGMEMAGHECIGYVEIDKFARKSYQAIHDTEREWTACDITTVSDDTIRGIGHTDIICGGFPCQAFSIAGKRAGFNDTRGTLFFEIMRFTSILKPKYLFLENVKGLLNHESGDTFETIIRTMDELGYDVEWQVFNSKDFGVPQNRERVFIIGHSRGQCTRKVFPIGWEYEKVNQLQGQQIYANTLTARYNGIGNGSYLLEREQQTQVKIYQRPRGNNKGGIHEIAPTITSNSYQDNNHVIEGIPIKEATKKGYDIATIGDSINLSVPSSETRRGRVGKGVANTLDTQCNQGTLTSDFRIRKLTPRECWRLQGFPDWAFDKAAEVNSDSQLYKQAGNSVTVNVIYEIAKGLE